MPLLAGAARARSWDALCWDLTEAFSRTCAVSPAREAVKEACARGDFEELDQLYFLWEDQFQTVASNHRRRCSFGLLSGFHHDDLSGIPLGAVASALTSEGTIFDTYYRDVVLPRLHSLKPSVIGITIASHHQVIAALRLLQFVREALPKALIILGGNVVTRLRHSNAFRVLQAHADQVVIYQGDLAFGQSLQVVESVGVQKARKVLPLIAGDQQVAYESWPVPCFDGIDFDGFVGIPVLPYVSTRGCYWGRCNFCAIPMGWSEQGYAGSAPAQYVKDQLVSAVQTTGIRRIKFVDEALSPAKAKRLASFLRHDDYAIEWEAYARLEKAWEDLPLLHHAYAGGLRKLYFGLEQAPTTNRAILNKNDHGDIRRIMTACHTAGIKLHLFCMVGHPRSTTTDAWATTNFLIDNQMLIDTADLVGFRLDHGTTVPGVAELPNPYCDWQMSRRYTPTEPEVLSYEAVGQLEAECQEAVWVSAPRLLHPLYRIVGPWSVDTSAYRPHSIGALVEMDQGVA